MVSTLAQLSDRSLRSLLEAIAAGRLSLPFSSLTLAQLVPQCQLSAIKDELDRLQNLGLSGPLLIEWIRTLLQEREQRSSSSGQLELVMTGPEPPGAMIRDTGVVVRQMFFNATQSIWICGYAVYQGQEVFQSLAHRMTQLPDLHVRMFLNIQRPHGDNSPREHLVAKFRQRFKETQWPPDARLPEIYFDPRSLETNDSGKSACLHAKFVITDSRQVFVSSANFTEAAQERNIEAGILLQHPAIAVELQHHFQALLDHEKLTKLKWH